jgi:hypothetical protein
MIDGMVYNTVFGLAFMISLVLTPLTLAEYIVFKIKKGETK